MKKKSNSRIGLILLAFMAFISLGLPDGLLGVGWPSIRAGFSLPLDALGMLLVTGTAGYLTSSFFSGRLISRIGVGGLLAASCALTGAALVGYTLAPSWGVMVALGIFTGLGAGAIDAGLNTYVAANFGEGLMQWLHASYGIGVTLGPIIMTTGLNLLSSWRAGYDVVGGLQIALGLSFLLTLSMWARKDSHPEAQETKKLTDYKTSYRETLRQPGVWLSMLMFFFYVGCEASMGAWVYSLLTESRGIAPGIAGLVAGSYWAMFTVGRFLAGVFSKRIGLRNLLFGSLVAAITGVALLWWNPSDTISLIGVALTGFAIAPIFPGWMSETTERVGDRYAANTIGMQIGVSSLGAASIPGLVGVLAANISLEVIPVCLFVLFVTQLGLYVLAARRQKQVAAGANQESQEVAAG